jgi:hypothetical protein
MVSEFLNILERISFDDTLFRKEFIKTLNWVSYIDYPVIEEWMYNNQIPEKFPDLAIVFNTIQQIFRMELKE